ncbi:electron transfer flavoprotein subunit beta/FixA family protein [Arthrobacter sp. I2-34]|uniref:Electron transfer flavoprotein subunit beta n=1 Tax=Arthrobacter hankyongi TaxID=2904801 RepID=A0ABS9L3K5_9MICC|nr:electron transfer flavoprotein subunit beta/FixA family protein [Arthrobacter hankyongi]MCG2621282.1 electron transfer flavoprotein subunit beta/FixA family protein [Arthrobacter hankyongi]
MKIVVLVKQVPDTYEDRKLDTAAGLVDRGACEPVLDEINERALEVALRYRDGNKGTEVVLLSMGPEGTASALRKGLSMGADVAVHVLDSALSGADLGRTAAVLAAALRATGFDLVIAGNASTDGGGGVVPAMVAEHLGLPHLTFLDAVEISAGTVAGVRATEHGSLGVHALLPAVISVTERSAEARFPNFKGILKAKKKPLQVLSLAEIGLDPAFAGAGRSAVVTAAERPARTGGTRITDEGTAGEQLADFLASARLI